MNKKKNFIKKNRGFTLIEILIVAGLAIFIEMSLLTSFLSSKVNLAEVNRIMIADIRQAQADTISSKQFKSTFRCGYGLHMLTSSQASTQEPFGQSYYIFTTKGDPSSCGNFLYQPSDSDVVTSRILDPKIEVCAPPTGQDNCGASGSFPRFTDIFFKTPNGATYIDNKACPIGNASQGYSQILIRKKGASCPSSNCTYICVYASGKIESRQNACPALGC